MTGPNSLLRRLSAVASVSTLVVAGLASGASAEPEAPVAPTGRESVVDTPATPGASAAPAPGDRGVWRVEVGTPGTYSLTWRAPERLPITDDRPEFYLGDTLLGAPELARDGRTLTLEADLPGEPSVEDLSVELSGRAIDTTLEPVTGTAVPYVEPAAGPTLATDPGEPGPYAVVSEDYELPGIKAGGFPAALEMVGHVERPADAVGPRPLVLFLHGRHSYCYDSPTPTGSGTADWPCPRGTSPVPSHLGYRYVQRLLASQGYVTVSIAANGVNAQDWRVRDGGAGARARLVRAHLNRWTTWVGEGRYDVDLQKVFFVGHSRGGEGVNRASLDIPLSAPYRVAGQLLLAPTDFGRQVAGHIPTVTLLPYCDGDVVDLQGQGYTDLGRDMAPGDTALRSSLMVMGANHNFFNTEWTPRLSQAPSWDDVWDDSAPCGAGTETRLTAAEQRAVGRTYIAGAVGLLAGGQDELLPMFDGSQVEVPSAQGADVRSHAVDGGRETRAPGLDATLGATSDATSRLCVGRAGGSQPRICGIDVWSARTPHWLTNDPFTRGMPTQRAMQMDWQVPGGSAALRLTEPLDLRTAPWLDLRTIVDTGLGPVRLQVRLRDELGHTTTLTPENDGLLRPFPGRDPYGKLWAQTLRVPLDGLSGLARGRITEIELVGLSTDGRIWLLDASTGTETLPAAEARRLPRIVLDPVQVVEGDETTEQTIDVPFRVLGEVTEPAKFVVTARERYTGSTRPVRTVAVEPGQTSGTVPVTYLPDRRDDLRVQPIDLAAYAVGSVMTSRYTSVASILDDDPAPRLLVERKAKVIREGRRAVWVVRLSRPADYYVELTARPVRGTRPVPAVRVSDVPRRWLREHGRVPRVDRPLFRTDLTLWGMIRPGRPGTTLSVPLVRDGVAEGREGLTLRVRGHGGLGPVDRTIVVRDPS